MKKKQNFKRKLKKSNKALSYVTAYLIILKLGLEDLSEKKILDKGRHRLVPFFCYGGNLFAGFAGMVYGWSCFNDKAEG